MNVEVSELPRARKDSAGDALYRPGAALLYRALKSAGDEGLSWTECYTLLSDAEAVGLPGAVGRHVVWMRARGVVVCAYYEHGETRFRLEVV